MVTGVNPKKLDTKFAGRQFDESLLEDLPAEVDSCGENGEFHTFVYDGQVFKKPIPVEVGELVLRDGFQFADLLSSHGPDPVDHHGNGQASHDALRKIMIRI